MESSKKWTALTAQRAPISKIHLPLSLSYPLKLQPVDPAHQGMGNLSVGSVTTCLGIWSNGQSILQLLYGQL